MPRLALENLDQEERAFVELIEGLQQKVESLKIVFPTGRYRVALDTMQEMQAVLVAAALKSGR
jgi:predicted  nucleic acid-binding Zn-ribbon protein